MSENISIEMDTSHFLVLESLVHIGMLSMMKGFVERSDTNIDSLQSAWEVCKLVRSVALAAGAITYPDT